MQLSRGNKFHFYPRKGPVSRFVEEKIRKAVKALKAVGGYFLTVFLQNLQECCILALYKERILR